MNDFFQSRQGISEQQGRIYPKVPGQLEDDDVNPTI